MMTLAETMDAMNSHSYKERFIAEYAQTRIRYEKLKAFNNKVEASEFFGKKEDAPAHDCPYELLKRQEVTMGEYLHILEVRAVMENIYLEWDTIQKMLQACDISSAVSAKTEG